MADALPLPAGFREPDFLNAYHASTLRKPQIVADSILRALVMAGTADRPALVAVLAGQAAEAARRLTHVHLALSDRTYSVARTLSGPLPGAEEWQALAGLAGRLSPEQMLWHTSVGDAALESATRLRALPQLGGLTDLLRVFEGDPPALMRLPGEAGNAPRRFLLASGRHAVSLGAGEEDAGNLADLTADFVSIARGFLGAYLHGRLTAGRRE